MKPISFYAVDFLVRRCAYHSLTGRVRDPEQTAKGRFTRMDIRELLGRVSRKTTELLPGAELDRLRSRGNRLNRYLGVVSLASYRSFRELGVSHEHTITLFGDTGWQLYLRGFSIPRMLSRLVTSDPQRRLNISLRIMIYFPFAEDPNGYHRSFHAEKDHYRTDWSRCVVLDYFRKQGSEEEIDFFRRTWCQYDFSAPRLFHPDGYYRRPRTLSEGDSSCQMYWYAGNSADTRKPELPPKE